MVFEGWKKFMVLFYSFQLLTSFTKFTKEIVFAHKEKKKKLDIDKPGATSLLEVTAVVSSLFCN